MRPVDLGLISLSVNTRAFVVLSNHPFFFFFSMTHTCSHSLSLRSPPFFSSFRFFTSIAIYHVLDVPPSSSQAHDVLSHQHIRTPNFLFIFLLHVSW